MLSRAAGKPVRKHRRSPGICSPEYRLGAADDLEAVIVEFIAGARSKRSIAVQELDSEGIARAILDASWRSVHVDLCLEQDYLRTPSPAGFSRNI